MSKKPIIIKKNSVETLSRVLLNSKTFQEDWLQNILEYNPNLLPTSEIDWIVNPFLYNFNKDTFYIQPAINNLMTHGYEYYYTN